MVFAWVVFRAESTDMAYAMIKPMIMGPLSYPNNIFPYFGYGVIDLLWMAGGLLIVWFMPNIYRIFQKAEPALAVKDTAETSAFALLPIQWSLSPVTAILCGLMLAVGIAAMGGYSPFLYFRF